jgi:hypothetical protein
VMPAGSTALPIHHHLVHGRVSLTTGGQSGIGTAAVPVTSAAVKADADSARIGSLRRTDESYR